MLEARAEKLYTNVYAHDEKQKKKAKKSHFNKAVASELSSSLDQDHPNYGHYGQDTAKELKAIEAWKEKIATIIPVIGKIIMFNLCIKKQNKGSHN